MNTQWKQYNVFEGTQVLFSGNVQEIVNRFGGSDAMVRKHAQDGRFFQGKYIIKETEPKESKSGKMVEYLTKHLDLYGNTVIGYMQRSEVMKYVSILRKRGYQVTAKKIPDGNYYWWLITGAK